MDNNAIVPSVIPPKDVEPPMRNRATFSSEASQLRGHHIDPRDAGRSHSPRNLGLHSRNSSQLLEDLMRHPLDPLFEDATLTAHTISRTQRIVTHIISFILCVAVGFAGSQAVRILQGRSREKVRGELAAQLVTTTQHAQSLEDAIKKQQKELLILTRQTKNEEGAINKIHSTFITTAQSTVQGPGLVLTLTNRNAQDSSATQGRVTDGQSETGVTDVQLQYLLSLLWQGGAEAISINDVRIGPQTAVRSAGGAILVGITGVQSPYVIRAIGNADILRNAVNAQSAALSAFKAMGVAIDLNNSTSLTLPAANAVTLERARKE
ncbi:DUF881 domain-containing protein [Alloscardovia omnicolens]|uniref:DUF881 domain-containing protein n=1 Tax=Alloscardovia omnicolens TaxID=419015 RepID=UPI003A6AC0AC